MNKNKTTYKVLKLLADGRFHSGEALGKTLGITRSGIWKAIQQLQAVGIEIDAVTGKGYRIPQGIELLDKDQIMSQLTTSQLNEVIILNSIDSTNEHLIKKARQRVSHNTACLAEHQSAGRGRCGRQWVSSFGSSIYLSLLWHIDKNPSELVGLSLAIAVGVKRTLAQINITDGIQLKWPNDILWNGRKLAGTLIDLLTAHTGGCKVIIGVGLNLQIPYHLGKTIQQPWVDISHIIKGKPERNKLASRLINSLIQTMEQYNRFGLAPFIEEWNSSDPMIGKSVTLHTPNTSIEGVMQGISSTGALILLNKNNECEHHLSGELSLRLSQDK